MINNANIMVDEEPEITSYILDKLDRMLQYQFNDSTQDRVLLSADIAFLTDFLALEKVRRDDFEYTVTTEGDMKETEVPPLLFIPFVENAVKHNQDVTHSYVHLKFRQEEHLLSFECVNSKSSKPTKRDVGGLGLANIRRRLDLLFESRHILDIVETETTYTVRLQLNR